MAFDPRLKILIVDDTEAMRKILSGVLSKMGYLVIRESSNSKEALQAIKDAQRDGVPFQFVLCAASLKEMSGLDLLRTLRSDQLFKRVPFLMIFNEGDQGDAAEAVKAGVTNFVVRPFSLNVLEEKMAKIFQT